ncbi:MAG: prenyltransferase/squalene oxidase repeat-containing protein [Tenuifilaceae bacterium]|jgi:hypothetical protein|nr:prenyltransferase/squalene oxidase repeat-containing protein [Tenuifilaceae bacterium]
MNAGPLIQWFLQGDVSLQYQVYRYLLGKNRPDLQKRIATEGWGAKLLSVQKPDGHWGISFYQPKWTSTHYSMLDLRYLEVDRQNEQARRTVQIIIDTCKDPDGGINPAKTVANSDVCINGMFLVYACYFGVAERDLHSVIDFILSQQLPDGGFNCRSNRSGARHSSLHTTLSILEGILEYSSQGYTYRLDELKRVQAQSQEFILEHKLYKSSRTGEVIDKRFLMLSYPSRWRFDILRALVYFQQAQVPYDPRMADAIEVLLHKRRPDGTWPLQAKHSGQTHFDMEPLSKPSRWNTLRAMRVVNYFKLD